MYLKHAFGHPTELCLNVVQACEKCAHSETSIYMYDLILTMNVIKTHNLLLTRLMTTDRLAC